MKKIKFEDLFLINEDTLGGIDELVYNPVTGNPKSDDERGADGGVILNSISWGGHEDHLHIGATNKEVMKQIIDTADDMGLVTTENPYAKRDPNGKVDQVHTSGSFHYKTFTGPPPLVGAGVDISGDKEVIRKLIKWIHKSYKGNAYLQDTTTEVSNSSGQSSQSNQTTSPSQTTSSISAAPSSNKNVGRAYGFMTPFLSSLEPIKKQMQDKLTQTESFTSDNKIINEVKRIKDIMKL